MDQKPDMIRKNIPLPAQLWEAVDNYRHRNRIKTEADAVRQLIALGIEAAKEMRPRGVGRGKK